MSKAAFRVTAIHVLMIVVGLQSIADAQLFGNRTPGSSAGSQIRSPFGNSGQRSSFGAAPSLGPANQSSAPGGVLDGNERFVRGNRSRQDFVGGNRNDLSGFVGSEQAIGVGRVPAATDSFRLEATKAARINRPLPTQPAKGMYYPRLALDLEPNKLNSSAQTASQPPVVDAPVEIARRVQNVTGENVQLFMAGDTAILKGTVASQRIADLAVSILSFEPGIDRVDNQLVVGELRSDR